MGKRLTFDKIVKMILVRRLYASGYVVAAIAEVAAVSGATVRRWLKVVGG